jgi:hypothetical protein
MGASLELRRQEVAGTMVSQHVPEVEKTEDETV